jgi:serine/threonine protein kinase HipA of HipAB toxin-antitoxin module
MNQPLPVALPLDPERFLAAMDTIIGHLKATTGQSLHLVGDTRVLVPLALLLKGQSYTQEEIVSVLIRMRALQLLLDGGTLDEWIYTDDSSGEPLALIDEALGLVAAVQPLSGPNDLFDPRAFLTQVQRLVAARQTGRPRPTLEVPLA